MPIDKTIDTFVADLRLQMKRQYDRGVNRDLSRQSSQDLLKRNVTAVLQGVYRESLTQLKNSSTDADALKTKEEFSQSTLQVLELYDGIVEELLQYAIKKHNTSCALSNFPDEHKPSKTYVTEVIEAAAKDWENFAVQLNDVMTAPESQAETV